MTDYEKFLVKPGSKVCLDEVDARIKEPGISKKDGLKETKELVKRLSELQYLLYAEGKQSLLICLQGRDAAGKDGTIKHVFGAMNPQGCTVTGFKVPSRREASHDFLWRYHRVTPQRGHVAIFNRSHYEDVLIQRVHEMVPEDIWRGRYAHINSFEKLLADNGTRILKFYLHIDPEEQLERFKKRMDDPNRHWKISDSDYTERPYWDDYTKAFEDALGKCSTEYAPWFIIPANRKWFRNLVISRIILQTMESMNMKFPAPTVDINEIKKKYHAIQAKEAMDEKNGE